MKSQAETFWLVWQVGGQNPRHQHYSEQEARTEAQRLAMKHPGKLFCVLRSVAFCQMDGVHWTETREAEEISF